MSEIFISYARGTEPRAGAIAEALRALGYGVWRDDEIPAHVAFSELIEERLKAAKAVIVLWSAAAVKSHWVRAEAEMARAAGTLVQASLDGATPPLPFSQTQCANLTAWPGERSAAGWRQVVASVAELTGAARPTPPPARSAPDLPSKPSIAVLPFVRADAEAALADGVVDEIVAALSRIQSLMVVGSDSSLAYRGDERSKADIARELGVRFILDGAVRRATDRLRISVKLTDTVGGGQIWAERFDGQAEDIFDLQDQVAISAAAQIAPSIDAAYTDRALTRPTDDLSAYELYLRAVHLEREFTRQSLEEAAAALELALQRDRRFALALGMASLVHSLIVLNGWADDPALSAQKALEFGRQALTVGTDDPDCLAHVATTLLWLGGDAESSDALIERALALNPGASLPWFASAWIKVFDGRPELAIEQWERHLRLDPRSRLYAFVAGGMGVALTLLHRFDEAVKRLREALHMAPHHQTFQSALVVALAHDGQVEEAARLAATLPAEVIANGLRLYHRQEDRDLSRAGFRLAGRAIED